MNNPTDSSFSMLGLRTIGRYVSKVVVALVLGGLVGWSGQFAVQPEFRAESSYAVVTNSGSGMASLSGLGGLAGLAGAGAGRLNLDQYVALIQNDDTLDAVILRHELQVLWKLDDKEKLRKKLRRSLRVWIGQKDQLVRIEVMMQSAGLAAIISNELGQLMAGKTSELASAEAKNRRLTLEPEVKRAQAALQAAQQHLVRAQLSPALARADSRTMAELVAKLQAELGNIEARLAASSTVLTPDSAETRQMLATRASIQSRLNGMQGAAPSSDFGYMEAFREFKYQEAVLEILLKQYESARIDEVKGGQYIHVVQEARPSDRPSFPDPWVMSATGALAATLLFGLGIFLRTRSLRQSMR